MERTRFSTNLGKVALGSIATLLAAGPCTAVLLFVLLFLRRMFFADDAWEWWAGASSEPPRTLAMLTVGASLTGLLGSLPATILNTAIQENLLRSGWDSWVVGSVAGSISGALVIGTFLRLATEISGPEMTVAMGLASILMGLLYWSIAIRPRRNLRLANVQPEAS
jgi:hypothetical protein